MRSFIKIALFSVAIFIVACRDMQSIPPHGDVVAKVGNNVLTVAEIKEMTPANLTGTDSLSFVKLYVDNWLIRQLKVEEAGTLFSNEVREIEKLVSDYRQSLLMRRVDQYHIDKNMSDDFTDDEITLYYNSHKANFVLDETLVKGVIVVCNNSSRKSTVLEDNIERVGSSASAIKTLEDACLKNGFTLINHYDAWVSFSDFLSNLPTTKSQNYDHILDRVGVQEIVANNTRYYFFIASACRKGNIAPVEVVSDNIRRILITQRRSEIIKSHEQAILDKAFEEGHAQIVKQVAAN